MFLFMDFHRKKNAGCFEVGDEMGEVNRLVCVRGGVYSNEGVVSRWRRERAPVVRWLVLLA